LARSLRRLISLPDAFPVETGASKHNRTDGAIDPGAFSKKETGEIKLVFLGFVWRRTHHEGHEEHEGRKI
jgi:hypothetical protein